MLVLLLDSGSAGVLRIVSIISSDDEDASPLPEPVTRPLAKAPGSLWRNDEIEVVMARVAPAIVRLLQDEVPRSKTAIVRAH